MSEAASSGDRPSRQEILDNHFRVGELLERLEKAERPAELAPVLEECRLLLPRHFAQEEAADGLFGIIGRRSPHARSEVEALVEEHRALLRDLGGLTQRAKARPDQAGLLTEAAQFCQQIRRHERRETHLLVDALGSDAGGIAPRPE